MIDIDKAKKEFRKYVSNYNPENKRIALKIDHIERVAENSKIIAQNLNLSEEDIHLAELIGLFHDIGRFEQVRIADTFSDKESGINHGELSAKILFENNFIRNFIEDDSYDKLIKIAVVNHNRAKIDSNISERELLFSKIIRDADKLDIFYNITFSDMLAVFWYPDFNDEKISDEIMNQLFEKHSLDYSYIKNNADVIAIFYAFIFDLNFDITLQILKEKKYLDIFTKRVLETFQSPIIHNQMQEIEKMYKSFLA